MQINKINNSDVVFQRKVKVLNNPDQFKKLIGAGVALSGAGSLVGGTVSTMAISNTMPSTDQFAPELNEDIQNYSVHVLTKHDPKYGVPAQSTALPLVSSYLGGYLLKLGSAYSEKGIEAIPQSSLFGGKGNDFEIPD